MASVKLSQLYGGGQFKAEFFSGGLSHSLSSTTPLTIAPASGKTLRLDSLASDYGAQIDGVTVSVGPLNVINNKNLSESFSAAGFVVSNGITGNSSGATTHNTVQPLIAFEPDQTITINTTTTGARPILYSYSYGE